MMSLVRAGRVRPRPIPAALMLAGLVTASAAAQTDPPTDPNAPPRDENVTTLDLVSVVGVSPVAGTDISAMKLPYNVQSINDDALRRSQSLDLTDFMNRGLAGVTINSAQDNPLQPDVQFRGFTATPLLGGSEGV